jgi:hypothetical protein
LGALLAVPAVLVLGAAAIYAIGDAVLAPAPTPVDPGFIDTILGSRAVVAAVRLAVISAGVFVVASVAALIARGQWLTRVGPVQVAQPVADIGAESQRLEDSLAEARETIGSIRNDLLENERQLKKKGRDEEKME